MNPLVLYFIDGTSFFAGLALALAALAVMWRKNNRWAQSALDVMMLLGVVLVIASATPQPAWAYGMWIAALMMSRLLLRRKAIQIRLKVVGFTCCVAMTLRLVIAEWPYQFLPRPEVVHTQSIYVVGDSISAGAGGNEEPWPRVLTRRGPWTVINLARPGATVQAAIKQAENIQEPGSLVILEIGGNDLLGSTDAATFQSQLETLIASIHSRQHPMIMFELPLFPFQNEFGCAQRKIASRYKIPLIPKRFFTRVLGSPGATIDGLHFSQKGHDEMAAIVRGVLRRQGSPSE